MQEFGESLSPVPSHRWYVAQTHIHAETKAAWHLNRQGFEIYLPRYLRSRRHARRVDRVAAPLFPRYLFVAIDMATQRWHSIQSTIGIVKLISYSALPIPVPEAVVKGLKARENEDGFISLETRPRFSPGDAVLVRDGAFSECLGLFEGISGEERSSILLELLGRKVRVLLNTNSIEAA